MWKQAKWLKVPMEEIQRKKIYHGDMTGRFAYFRCEAEAPEGARLTADISASSRYRLWVNGKPALSGPCKGDERRQYYETVELTDLLVPGRNVFCDAHHGRGDCGRHRLGACPDCAPSYGSGGSAGEDGYAEGGYFFPI